MTINYSAGRRERVPVKVTLLIRDPRELLSSLSPVNMASRNATGAEKREGKAKRLKLRRNSTQRLRLQPLDPYPIPFPIYKISGKLPPSLVLNFHTHFLKKGIWREEGGKSCLDISKVQACQHDSQLRRYRIKLRYVQVEGIRSCNRQWGKSQEKRTGIRVLCIVNPWPAGDAGKLQSSKKGKETTPEG